MMDIDDAFVQTWEHKYDVIESDEEEYRRIVELAQEDVSRIASIGKDTLQRIVRWKAWNRSCRYFDWDNYGPYQAKIAQAIRSEDHEKMGILVSLRGVLAPTASTILHFVDPHRFPIYDIRTVQVLHHFGYLSSKTVSASRYQEFRKAIENLKEKLGGKYTLRQIDRALFAYHKMEIGNIKTCSKPAIKEHAQYTPRTVSQAAKRRWNSHTPFLLTGRIRRLSQRDRDGWERREIIVGRDGSTRYPDVRDKIEIVDSDGELYRLSFIKGAHVSGYTCLGQPGVLKKWFQKHYQTNIVTEDTVYFEAAESANVFRIWTSQQWAQRALHK
jgi:hypothetical protein